MIILCDNLFFFLSDSSEEEKEEAPSPKKSKEQLGGYLQLLCQNFKLWVPRNHRTNEWSTEKNSVVGVEWQRGEEVPFWLFHTILHNILNAPGVLC